MAGVRLGSVPVLSREEFDALAPIDHRRGLADAPEPDDGGLWVLAACGAAGVALAAEAMRRILIEAARRKATVRTAAANGSRLDQFLGERA